MGENALFESAILFLSVAALLTGLVMFSRVKTGWWTVVGAALVSVAFLFLLISLGTIL